MAAGVTIYTVQTTNTTLLGAELNALAAAAFTTTGTAFNNSAQTIGSVAPTANLGGYLRAKIHIHLGQFTTAPAAGGTLNLWFLHSIDGTTYDDRSANPRPPDVVVPVEAQNTAAQEITMDVKLPAGLWVLSCQNNTSQPLAATGNTIVAQPYTAGE